MSTISLPGTANLFVRSDSFGLKRSEVATEFLGGITQVTSFPDRRWKLQLDFRPMRSTDIRDWNLFVMRLTSLANVFAYGPPYYSGPTSGYAGASPLVNGASQTGSTLAVDGLTPSVAILKAGDFFSFDVTTGLGNTNRQLNAVTADVSSNGSGQASFALLVPIRLSPADNAAVNITTPTAFFRLENPESALAMDVENFGTMSVAAIERTLP